jgi:hypothetical protein
MMATSRDVKVPPMRTSTVLYFVHLRDKRSQGSPMALAKLVPHKTRVKNPPQIIKRSKLTPISKLYVCCTKHDEVKAGRGPLYLFSSSSFLYLQEPHQTSPPPRFTMYTFGKERRSEEGKGIGGGRGDRKSLVVVLLLIAHC